MIYFKNDYSIIAHQKVLDLIQKTSLEHNPGYGLDDYSDYAKKLIKRVINKEDVDIHFLVGGTSCNKIVISHLLRPYEAVISVASGHINVHETGAIEATGHKIILTPGVSGKITSDEIRHIVATHTDEHMVVPKMVYISNSTEIGTIYKKKELEEIFLTCKELGLYLYVDGARLGVALTSKDNDLSLEDFTNLCDLFYIGGTKNGAMLGEALVINNPNMKESFRHSIKQNGGMLAKGFLIGIQFVALFTDNLYFELAKTANERALQLKEGFQRIGVKLAYESPTNQQFIRLKNEIVQNLQNNYAFEVWEKGKDETVIRLVTSFATTNEEINKLLMDVKSYINQ